MSNSKPPRLPEPPDDESKSTIDVSRFNKGAFDELEADEIRLHMPERDTPLVFRNKVQITIGRRDKKRGIQPDVDLTTDHGSSLGVSRKHAEIRKVNDLYYVVDMDSSNGTFVNDTQIQPFRPRPLENGDQIRMGHFVMLVQIPVTNAPADAQYTQSNNAAGSPTGARGSTIKITSPNNAQLFTRNGIAFNFMTDFLSAYLDALEDVHTLIRHAQGDPVEPLVIETMLLDVTQKMVVLQVRGGSDVIQFFQKKMPPFVEEEKKLFQEGNTRIYQQDSATPTQTIATEDLAERVANHILEELVYRFLNEERDNYIKELAIPIRVLLASDLRMSAY